MKVVVTGAAGLTGSVVARTLADRGHEVVGVVRRTEQKARVATGVDPAVADCDDPAAVATLLADADAVVHVAGITVWRGLAGAPTFSHPPSVVVVSSAGVYSRHRASAVAYLRGENELRVRRPDAVIVRPTMIYGSVRDRNVHHVIALARRWGVLPYIDGGGRLIQPIHYEDLAVALCALVGRTAASPLDAGGAAPITLLAAARCVFTALGRPARLVRVPAWPALLAAGALDAARGSRLRERIERMSEDRAVDNAPFLAATGVHLRTFADGVRDEVREMYGEAS